jgi:hypothetical protein
MKTKTPPDGDVSALLEAWSGGGQRAREAGAMADAKALAAAL